MRQTNQSSLWLLGISHFGVDFVCTLLLASLTDRLSIPTVTACAILYNGLAFAFQLPIGALGDLAKMSRGLAAFGCLLVAIGALISCPIILCLLIGLGNACFHVGGGREALLRGKEKASLVGKFVAPGAIGIFLGPRLAQFLPILRYALPVALSIPAVLLLISRRKGLAAEKSVLPAPSRLSLPLLLSMVCLFLTVLLRSYMGTVLRYPILRTPLWAAFYTLSIFAGKFLGGILSDRFGLLRFNGFAQLVSTALFALSVAFPALAFPAIFLFNTSMAVTATTLYRIFPRCPGTMFGLTTFALYLGVLPRLLGWENIFFSGWGLGLLSLLSALLLTGSLILVRGGGLHDTHTGFSGAVPGTDAAP